MPNPIKHSDLIQQGNPAKQAIKSIELLEQTLADSNKSIQKSAQGIADSLKKVNVTTKKGREATIQAANETQKLTDKQKQNAQTLKLLEKEKAKLLVINGKLNKELIATRVETQKANKDIKQNALITRSQAGSYDKLTASLNRNVAKWKAMSAAQRTGTIEGKRLTATIKQQDAQLKKLDKQIGRSQRNVGNYGSAFTSLGAAMGVTMGAAGVFMVLKNAVGVIAGFEKEMAKVKAISGATSAEFEQLKNQAKALGASTLFTAQQVAELEVAYSKLGFSTTEILNATAATLDLAVATDSDLSAAAEVAGSTLRGFGLDASEMGRVVDVMAKGFTTSALDIENFREAMKLVAPIAKAAGIDIEVTTNLLGKLADAGLKGSIGATGLKNVLLELSNENSALSKHIGFSVKNADDLQKAFNQLQSESLTLAEAQGLIDKRGQAALLTLSNNKDIANLLVDSYKDVDGAARKMAATMETTLSASVTFLGSAWDGFILKMENSKGVMKTVVDSFTRGLEALTNDINVQGGTVGFAISRMFGIGSDAIKEAETEISTFYDRLNKLTVDEINQRIPEQVALVEKLRSEGREREAREETRRLAAMGKRMAEITQLQADAAKAKEDADAITLKKEQDAAKKSNEIAAKKALDEKQIVDKANRDQLALEKEFDDLMLEQDEKMFAEQDKIEQKENAQTLSDMDKFNAEKAKKRDDDNQAALDSQRQALENAANLVFNFGSTLQTGYAQALNGITQSITEFAIIAEDLAQGTITKAEATALAIQASLALIGEVGTGLFNQRAQEIDQEMLMLQESKAYELSLVQGNAEEEAKVNAKFAAKEKALKLEKAKNDRNAAIFSAIINTAVAVVSALTVAPPLGIILAALVGAAGAVEIATIASTPLPKFEEGGHGIVNSGHGVLKGDRHSAKSGGIPVGVAEGGEYFGVVNREKTKQYSDDLPSIFNSLNSGNFDDIWSKTNDQINVNVNEKYGRKMYEEMRNKESFVNGKRLITRGRQKLYVS
jgi:TP901 family phage tail tape measure protein